MVPRGGLAFPGQEPGMPDILPHVNRPAQGHIVSASLMNFTCPPGLSLFYMKVQDFKKNSCL